MTGAWQASIARPNPQLGADHFRFLNQDRRISTWNDAGVPKLWLYNLHYFEHPAAELMERWVRENPVGQGSGWEPYPLSLRIGNWIKWLLAGNPLSDPVRHSLVAQASFLSQSIEYHLLANHIFADAKALVFAGLFFQGPEASRWLATGLDILEKEVPEQILADGGHFERSPMYHSLILEDLLDLVNLTGIFPDVVPEPIQRRWMDVAAAMLGWHTAMCHPDGRISFFNDAAFGVAPEFDELSSYAQRLGIASRSPGLSESGYVRLETDKAVVLFDAALIGPDYQPGHAHSDTLSFELSVFGRRVLVNSGTATYESSEDRQKQRATAAHNTIRVDRQDQSETWGAFRVARRARPVQVKTDRAMFAEAAHTGYLRLKDPVLHTRRLELKPDALMITDRLEARGVHELETFFHVHPDAQVSLSLDPKLSRSVEDTEWFPEFNRRIPNKTIVGRWAGQCPVEFVTRVSLS